MLVRLISPSVGCNATTISYSIFNIAQIIGATWRASLDHQPDRQQILSKNSSWPLKRVIHRMSNTIVHHVNHGGIRAQTMH